MPASPALSLPAIVKHMACGMAFIVQAFLLCVNVFFGVKVFHKLA